MCSTGEEIASSVFPYPHGKAGILLDERDPDVARQHPQDYLDGALAVITGVLAQAAAPSGLSRRARSIGLGVDTTGSTPIPVDADGTPLALKPEFDGNLAAMVYLWKDHTGHAEAAEITALAAKIRPQYLAKCGGTYSAEWYWAKVLRCLRADPDVFEAAYTWVEHADWLPAVLTGETHPDRIKRGICAAGHKAMFHPAWGGYPDEEFLAELDPRLVRLRRTLPGPRLPCRRGRGHAERGMGGADRAAGGHSRLRRRVRRPSGRRRVRHQAGRAGQEHRHLHLRHDGRAAGQRPARTSPACAASCPSPSCRAFTAWKPDSPPSATSSTGSSTRSSLAGQGHEELTEGAAKLLPGESGLLALDWHNGNRTVLVDQRLTGGDHRPDPADDARRDVPRLDRGDGLRGARHHGAV